MNGIIPIILAVSAATVVAPPFVAWRFGRKGLHVAFWAILSVFAAHLIFAYALPDPMDSLIGWGYAALSCLAGILSVAATSLAMNWSERRTVTPTPGE